MFLGGTEMLLVCGQVGLRVTALCTGDCLHAFSIEMLPGVDVSSLADTVLSSCITWFLNVQLVAQIKCRTKNEHISQSEQSA